MSGANGTKVPNASQRQRQIERETAKAENSLADLIGQAVALRLAELLPQMLGPLRATLPACLVCCVQRKGAERMAAQVAAFTAAAEETKRAAEDSGETPPEIDIPQVQIPDVQESVTVAPIVLRADMPPVPAPVCYEHLPASGAEAGLPPQERDIGLVGADGKPIIATSR